MRPFIVACLLLTAATPSGVIAADRVVTLIPGHPFAEAIRIGTASGGPNLRDVVAPDIAAKVFTSKSDDRPANAWFTRTYEAALRTNGFLARTPALARYALNAEVATLAITPSVTGSHTSGTVTYRLIEIATGRQVWSETQTVDFDVRRGMRFGKIGGAVGLAVAGALTGQNPAVTGTMINGRGVRPFDTRIDVYEGIMRGFQHMAQQSMKSLSLGSNAPEPARIAPVQVAVATPARASGQEEVQRASPSPAPIESALAIRPPAPAAPRRAKVSTVPVNDTVEVPYDNL
ncbi:hypothetical protein HL653_18470 [Sphingomonas sp. AP4-R1]|uniref:hypothetical protein n=1 Tax=Sphingomonas sp. AP4-R1 TaxID=2735134 RepID=UPI0014934C06|nr:hypothetical protein [Sphingomonas sp. AP4-R1]QJU59472.1 hypothetical protein HL653_18470 [Sphingomonas sp. AP4-R1]